MSQLFGRSSSHFTRVPRIFAHELGLELELVVIHDVTSTLPGAYGGNPALKLPTLARGEERVFGAENICRALAELAPGKRIVWPEQLHDGLCRNATELVWHAMSAQVQLVFGTVVNKLPLENPYFAKGRAGFEGALQWLDRHLPGVLEQLPERDFSLLEVTLFCLLEHLTFRQTLSVAAYPALASFAKSFGVRPSALATGYRFDAAV